MECSETSTPRVCRLADKPCREFYEAKNPLFKKVFEFIDANGLDGLKKFPEGKHPIDADKVFVNFSDTLLKKPESAKFEVHDKYVDLQLVISGVERMGIKPRGELSELESDKMSEKDVKFYSDLPSDFLDLRAGEYVVFFPENGHAPAIGDGTVRKCIFKILAQ